MPGLAEKLVGRTAELGSLEDTLAELGRQGPRAVQLLGEPGIGKTRLLAELGTRADGRGHLVLAGSASELERDIPFWLFVDALDDYVHGLEPHRLARLGPEVHAQLAHVLPSLSSGRAEGAGARDERYRTHRAMCTLLETLAEPRPLVLLLDDLHWADDGSIELLGALLRRPPDASVLIALAVRPRQVPERLAAALARADRAGGLTRLELGALNEAEALELIGDGRGDGDAEALLSASGGNPFYLELLVRSGRRPDARPGQGSGLALAGVDVPPAVAAALSDELALVGPAARRVLEGAAVAGDPFEPELAAAAADVGQDETMEALDELLERDLIRPTDVPRRFRFRHPLVRGAVYAAAPGGWRIGAHARCAAELAARGSPAVERAHHVERSARHGDAAAIAVLREAAEAIAPRAPATAARLYDAALRLMPGSAPERSGVLAPLAAAHAAAGAFAPAREAMIACLDLLPEGARAERAELTAMCAGMEHLLGRHDEAHARLSGSVEALGEDGSADAVPLMIFLAVDGLFRMDYASMHAWGVRAVEAARPLGDPALTASTCSILAMGAAFDGAIDEGRQAAAAAAAALDPLGDDVFSMSLEPASRLAAAELYLEDYSAASAHTERVLAVARAAGRGNVLPILFWTGVIRWMRGDLREAAAVLDAAVEIARLSGHVEGQAWNLFVRSQVATTAGETELALATAEESVEAMRGSVRCFPKAGAGLAHAAALLGVEDPAAAIDALLLAGGGEELPLVPMTWQAGTFELLTRCRLALGRIDDAARTAEKAEARADALGQRMARAMADRAVAAVAYEQRDARLAADRALRSAVTLEEVGAVVEGAFSRVLAGRSLALAGEPAPAAAELQRAAAVLDARGAVRHRDEAERELRRLGHRRLHRRSRPGDLDSGGVGSLTERELQVARLVVDRRTNRQIAAELFLSQKTVETHMRNLFHKLDVSSRVEVARAIERADRNRSGRAPAAS